MKSRNRFKKKVGKFFGILLLIAGILGLGYYKYFVNRPGANRRPHEVVRDENAPTMQMKVGTININGFRYLRTPDIAAEFLLSKARKESLDILLVQEFVSKEGLFSTKDFIRLFGKEFPYILVEGEHAILSKTKILKHEIRTFVSSVGTFAVFDVQTRNKKDVITVYSVHLQSTGVSGLAAGWYGPILALGSESYNMYKANYQLRLHEAMVIRDKINLCENPVIVAGDFNCVPLSKVYRWVKGEDLHDSFMKKGRGKGSTYRSFKNTVRIDYILYSSEFTCLDCFVPDDFLSDHRMVISTLEL